MSPHNVRAWALIQAELTRVEGMRVANVEREYHGHALAYDEQSFLDSASKIEQLAESIAVEQIQPSLN